MNPRPDDDIQALAGEYVLGTLSSVERADVEQRLPGDAALRSAVDAWEVRLHPLVALVPPADPSQALWPRIARSVEPMSNMHVAAAPKQAARSELRTGWWNSLQLWRGLAGSGFAAAAVMAAVLVTRSFAPAAPQYMVVLVAPADKAPGWVVQTGARPAGGGAQQLSLIPLGNQPVPEGRSLQFWTKANAWRGPVSLGLVTPGRSIRVPIEQLPPLEADQLFELTLEPAAGSPIDRPTGPIQFIGRAVKVL
ncbi:anti-sigma factor [Variovorax sp. RHLX14]|uniref:anti-sigma factor n=1 Tax=Variovorax sp. RHLX14 TaxID=1259731 RepID=UPI003F482246